MEIWRYSFKAAESFSHKTLGLIVSPPLATPMSFLRQNLFPLPHTNDVRMEDECKR